MDQAHFADSILKKAPLGAYQTNPKGLGFIPNEGRLFGVTPYRRTVRLRPRTRLRHIQKPDSAIKQGKKPNRHQRIRVVRPPKVP